MLKNFDSSLSCINNETKIALYIEIAKPLILSLPDLNDKVKAIAWFRKIILDSSTLLVRIEYLELLLRFLKYRKLSGIFAGLPDTRRPLKKFTKRIEKKQFANCENKTNNFIEQNDNYNTFTYKYVEVVHHSKNSVHNMQYLNKNNRIPAGYSPFTINPFNANNKKINRWDSSSKTSKNIDLLKFGYPKSAGGCKRENCFSTYNVTPTFNCHKPSFPNIFCKPKDDYINRTAREHNYVNDFEQGENNKSAEKVPIKEENKQNKELDEFCEICQNDDLETFLIGSKKYLTLRVSKECLGERNILKCVKYIINNAQCKFYKFKEYRNSEKIKNNVSKKNNGDSFLNNERNSYSAPENNQTFFLNKSLLERLPNLPFNNISLSFANAWNVFQNIFGKSIYIKISIILALGTIFFCKMYQIIFAYQYKNAGYSTKLVSQIYNLRRDVYPSYFFTFVLCLILYHFVKDFINIFI